MEVIILSRLLAFIHAFVGLGAMAGGTGAILNPEGPLVGTSVDILQHSPFSNFLIPGIILFTVIGLGNVVTAIMVYKKSRFNLYASSVLGWALVIWIVVQCIMLQAIHYLHVIFFVIGLIEVALAAFLIFKNSLYPANIIQDRYEKRKG